jgi:lipopolysaccharide/colanic/teichoic acid biosynthesis glycosyltransferase
MIYSFWEDSRMIQRLAVLVLLIVFSPALLAIAVALRLSGGPVFCGPLHRLKFCNQGALGRFLRRLGLDEMPRLISVLITGTWQRRNEWG